MKKSGFTLVELLAVIVILAVILAIAIPGIKGIIDSSKDQLYNQQVKIIKKAAGLYINDKIMKSEAIEPYITMQTLVDNSNLNDIPKNPKDGNYLSGVIKVTEENDEYKYEYLEVNHESGEVILADPTKKIKNITIEGNSEQIQTIQGNNLFDGLLEGGQWSTSTGLKINSSLKIRSANKMMVLPNTVYTLKNYSTNCNIYLLSYKNDGSFIKYEGSNIGTTTITTTSDTNYLAFYINSDGSTTGQGSLTDSIKLSLGGTASDYEPFIPDSPTPNYPSYINSSAGSNLKIGGCNLYNINTMPINLTTQNGDILSLNPATYDRILFKQYWTPKPSTAYTIVIDIIENTFTTPVSLSSDNRFYFNGAMGSIPIGTTGKKVFNTTTRSDFSTVSIGSLWFWTSNTVSGSFKFRLTILEGTYTLETIPPNTSCKISSTTNINIPSLNKIGNVRDTYNPLTGEYVQRIGIKTFTGTESWVYNTAPDKTFNNVNVFNISDTIWQNQQGLSTHFILNNNNDNTEHIRIASGYIFVYLSKLQATDLNSFKSYLAAKYAAGEPVIVYYQLPTPITWNLGAKVIPKDATYIYLDSKIKGNIIVEYQ